MRAVLTNATLIDCVNPGGQRHHRERPDRGSARRQPVPRHAARPGDRSELSLWVRDGATPWQALLAATRHAADLCGVGDDLGTVEPGKLADLIVVAADPLENITNLRRLLLVLKEGRIVSDKRGGSARD